MMPNLSYNLQQQTATFWAKKDRGTNWSDDETLALLEIWSDDRIQAELECSTRNQHIYQVISDALGVRGIERSGLQCRVRIKNLKKEYKDVMENKGERKRSFRFFDQLHAIHERKGFLANEELDILEFTDGSSPNPAFLRVAGSVPSGISSLLQTDPLDQEIVPAHEPSASPGSYSPLITAQLITDHPSATQQDTSACDMQAGIKAEPSDCPNPQRNGVFLYDFGSSHDLAAKRPKMDEPSSGYRTVENGFSGDGLTEALAAMRARMYCRPSLLGDSSNDSKSRRSAGLSQQPPSFISKAPHLSTAALSPNPQPCLSNYPFNNIRSTTSSVDAEEVINIEGDPSSTGTHSFSLKAMSPFGTTFPSVRGFCELDVRRMKHDELMERMRLEFAERRRQAEQDHQYRMFKLIFCHNSLSGTSVKERTRKDVKSKRAKSSPP